MAFRMAEELYVQEGQRCPKGYGLAYWDELERHAVLYRVPINLIVRLWWHIRRYLHGIAVNPSSSKLERELEAAYRQGYSNGKAKGWREGMLEGLAFEKTLLVELDPAGESE